MVCVTRGENIFDLELMSDEIFPLYTVAIIQCKPPYYLLLFEPTKPRKALQSLLVYPTLQKVLDFYFTKQDIGKPQSQISAKYF
jgi:hypothetical protein